MNLSTDQIRSLCTIEVFDRAQNYREDDRIDRIDRFGGTVQAAVHGSQPEPYEVEITTEDRGDTPADIDATCTCPYDWEGYCKHIIAVLLDLSECDTDLEDEREVVERVLSDAHPEELEDFLLDECERNPDLRRRLLTRFEQRDTESIYDYKKEMSQQYRGPYTHRYEGPALTEFHDLAEQYREQDNPLEAATIYRAMTEVRVENMDLIQDYYGEDFAEELDAFVTCLHEAALPHEGKREYIEYLFERWTSDDSAVGTFSGQYKDALWDLCTDDADLRYWRTLLEAQLPDEVPDTPGVGASVSAFSEYHDATRFLETYVALLDALDDTETLRTVYEQYYLDNSSFCRQYAELAAEEGDIDRAIEIAEEGLDEFGNADLRRFLLDLYVDRDPDRRRTLLRELFLQTDNWDYYEQLQDLCEDDRWDDIVDEFEATFEDSNVHKLIELYLRDGRTEAAFETVIESARGGPDTDLHRVVRDNGLATLSEYHADVADHDPETYEELLEPFLANTTGRDHYQKVIEYLEEMRELGYDERFEAFVARLKDKHSNRPAFLDEMSALSGV